MDSCNVQLVKQGETVIILVDGRVVGEADVEDYSDSLPPSLTEPLEFYLLGINDGRRED